MLVQGEGELRLREPLLRHIRASEQIHAESLRARSVANVLANLHRAVCRVCVSCRRITL